MLQERIEGKWVTAFAEVFRYSNVRPGEIAAILSETQSRPVLAQLSELALEQLGARPFHIQLCSPRVQTPAPVRSTGTSLALKDIGPAVRALSCSSFVVDCTVEGLLHTRELQDVLAGGARVLMISNEHPEILERTKPTPELRSFVRKGMSLLGGATMMRATSAAGTDLSARVAGAPARGATGIVDEPGRVGYWPAGLCVSFPQKSAVSGRIVLQAGDVNLTFKKYFESSVILTIENDYVVSIDGGGLDAELLRSYYAAWNDPEAYATSHVGWGMNHSARWDVLHMYDRTQINGTELRAFAGNFLYSTGSNENAKRFTACHFDFPMRGCSVYLDERMIVKEGHLIRELF